MHVSFLWSLNQRPSNNLCRSLPILYPLVTSSFFPSFLSLSLIHLSPPSFLLGRGYNRSTVLEACRIRRLRGFITLFLFFVFFLSFFFIITITITGPHKYKYCMTERLPQMPTGNKTTIHSVSPSAEQCFVEPKGK